MADEKKIIEEVGIEVGKLTGIFTTFQEVIKTNLTQQDQLISYMKKLKDTIGKSSELKDFIKVSNELVKTQKALSETQKKAIADHVKLEKMRTVELKTSQAAANALRAEEQKKQALIRTEEASARQKARLNKEAEKATRISQAATSAYQRESAKLLALTKSAKDAAIQYGVNSKQAKALRIEQQKLDKQIKSVDASLGIHNRSVGNYGKSLQGVGGRLLGAFGVVGGLQMLATALRNAYNVTKEYEKTNAELAGVLGINIEQTARLQKESKRLGATTAFSAKEVAALQVELARMGKTEADIIQMTEGIIDASIALGSGAAETATLVAATLNAYQLEAKESSNVADILTLSTQRSALSFEKLNTALPIVAGAASAAGYSLEQTVAMLGQAADRGIDASTSATALRNIFIELSAKGLTLDKALAQINASQDKLSTANELFGKRSAVTALALADTTDKTKDLTAALEDAGGTAKEVAETQLNTLDGQVRLLQSAWEGLILTVSDENGALTKFVGFLTNAIIGMQTLGARFDMVFKSAEKWNDATVEQIINFGTMDKTGASVSKTLEELADKYEKLPEAARENITLNQFLFESLLKLGEGMDISRRVVDYYTNSLEELGEAKTKVNNAGKTVITTETDLIKIQEELLKQAKEMSGSTEDDIRLRNTRIAAIEKEITRLKGLEDGGSDLIKIQEILLKQAREMPAATELEIKIRNRRVIAIEKEIERLKALGSIKEVDKLDTDAILKVAKDSFDALQELDQKEIDAYLDKEEKKTEILKDAEDKRQELIKEAEKAAADFAKASVNAIFETRSKRYEDDLEANAAYYDELLSNTLLDTEQRDLLEAERLEKENEINEKRRETEKKQFLFNQGIKAAEVFMEASKGIAAATAQAPATFGASLAWIPLIKITAAAQLATILAQSIPQFYNGTENSPEGLAWVGEKGTEMKITPDGKTSLTPGKPTLDYLEKGTKIIPHNELIEAVTNYSTASIVNEGAPVSNNDAMIAAALMELKKENKANNDRLLKALSNQPQTQDKAIDRMRKNALQAKLQGKKLYS